MNELIDRHLEQQMNQQRQTDRPHENPKLDKQPGEQSDKQSILDRPPGGQTDGQKRLVDDLMLLDGPYTEAAVLKLLQARANKNKFQVREAGK